MFLQYIKKEVRYEVDFYMHIKTSKFSTSWYYHYWWAWSRILKLFNVTSLQYLTKDVWDGVQFLHADKHRQVDIIVDGSIQTCPKYWK